MTKRQVASPAPGPLEAYAAAFDDLFERRTQRAAFRRYLEGLLLPAERNKTLTALANAEPITGIHAPRVQALQWFLSESTWEAAALNARRVELLRQDPATAPDEGGVLVIDETGDRTWGAKTAHVGRQYLGSIGKVDSGVVTVSTLWADDRVYWPLVVATVHTQAARRQGDERPGLSHQAPDRGRARPAGGRRGHPLSCGRGRPLLR